jgi:cell division protein FtsQ
MARKSGSTILQEELYPPYAGNSHSNSSRDEIDDARLVDLDTPEESPFLRAQKRVSARRGSLPKKTVNLLLWGCVAVGILGVAALGIVLVQHYGEHSWRFRLDSSDNIQVTGIENVTKKQIMEVMGEDIQRNIFSVPLKEQKAKLEQIPWVESASVMRFVPNRLKIEIHERTPVAFARVGPRIFLIDAGGTLMELPQKHKYSFPVILGMYPGEPLSTRVPRMRAFNDLMQQLDSGGAHYSSDLSEVDLSDLENLKVRVNDSQGDVLIELGSGDYLKRFHIYVSHVQEWRQQFQKLESVNLRYDNQVIVNPDMEGKPKQPALGAAAVKAAAAAGVKSAALITRINPHDHSLPKPVFEKHEKSLEAKAAVKKPAKPKAKKVVTHAVAPKKETAKHTGATHASPGKPDAKKRATLAASAARPKPSAAVPKPSAGQN